MEKSTKRAFPAAHGMTVMGTEGTLDPVQPMLRGAFPSRGS